MNDLRDLRDDLTTRHAVNVMNHQRPHFVYRAFDDGVLLYVGFTRNPNSRRNDHRRRSSWWTPSVVWELAEYPDYLSARAAEEAAILAEKPLHNVAIPKCADPGAVTASPVTAPSCPPVSVTWN